MCSLLFFCLVRCQAGPGPQFHTYKNELPFRTTSIGYVFFMLFFYGISDVSLHGLWEAGDVCKIYVAGLGTFLGIGKLVKPVISQSGSIRGPSPRFCDFCGFSRNVDFGTTHPLPPVSFMLYIQEDFF